MVAVYHFLDDWRGESGYLRVDSGADGEREYLWVEKYDLSQYPQAYTVCGSDKGEGKFSTLIDVTVPHRKNQISLEFGATLAGDPCK